MPTRAPSPRSAAEETDRWNLTRFEPHLLDPRRGHLESTFVRLNDPTARRALWIKQTIFAPTDVTVSRALERTRAEAWAIAFDRDCPLRTSAESGPVGPRHVAVKSDTPIGDASLCHRPPLRLEVAGVRFERRADGRHRWVGSVARGPARIRFDLTMRASDDRTLVHFPWPAMYEAAFPKSKLVSPMLDGIADGVAEIEVEGEPTRQFQVDGWRTMQGHNWGTRHADTYAWLHVQAWNEPAAPPLVVEGFAAKVRLAGPLRTPMVSMFAVDHGGRRASASTALDVARTRARIDQLRTFTFRARLAGGWLSGSARLTTEDTVGLHYPNPDGEMTYCLNSKLARVECRWEADGSAPIALTSDAAALEIATHDPHHGIRMYV